MLSISPILMQVSRFDFIHKDPSLESKQITAFWPFFILWKYKIFSREKFKKFFYRRVPEIIHLKSRRERKKKNPQPSVYNCHWPDSVQLNLDFQHLNLATLICGYLQYVLAFMHRKSIVHYLSPGFARLRKISAWAEEAPVLDAFSYSEMWWPTVAHPRSAATRRVTELWLLLSALCNYHRDLLSLA